MADADAAIMISGEDTFGMPTLHLSELSLPRLTWPSLPLLPLLCSSSSRTPRGIWFASGRVRCEMAEETRRPRPRAPLGQWCEACLFCVRMDDVANHEASRQHQLAVGMRTAVRDWEKRFMEDLTLRRCQRQAVQSFAVLLKTRNARAPHIDLVLAWLVESAPSAVRTSMKETLRGPIARPEA